MQSPVSFLPNSANLNGSAARPRSSNGERSHTPHLTPSSSRGSAGPSEGIPEAMTPLDVSFENMVTVASPTVEGQVIVGGTPAEPTIAPSLLMKRGSVHMDTDDEVEVPLADVMRKKARLDKSTSRPSSPTLGQPSNTTDPSPASISAAPESAPAVPVVPFVPDNQSVLPPANAMDEDDDDDDEEEEEFGPDGKRTVKYCLNMFTDEQDDGTTTCSLCNARLQQGLIEKPVTFTATATQDEKLQHFLDEHPTSWESLRQGTVFLLTVVLGVNAIQSTLKQQTGDWGWNPTGVGFFYYKPLDLVTNPALVVAIHYCTGTAQAYFNGTDYANLADTYKYIVIYPEAPDSGGCWDVHTTDTLTHNGGGDSIAIASMIRFAISDWGVDPKRVYVTGTSSGAMMTNVLAGAYPDLFEAGAAFAGVPYGCFAGPGMWNSACALGEITRSAQEWGDQVRSGYPGYNGPRPRMQLWHGTLDDILYYNNFKEGIKQWTDVFGYNLDAAQIQRNSPLPGWTRSIYGLSFQAITANDVDHDIPVQAYEVLKWFGIIRGERSAERFGLGWIGLTTCTTVPRAFDSNDSQFCLASLD
ncbi:hypothetical protein NP233_g11099 [Leucocoprinus birnbaumii]|uniref:Carboxylic ester hydrolase n=1 Tax=Leucocoprinus birnbaumii TaxID=56174 RepID=A0AAD5VHP2_9AGAR|nr:hypothetical protein NP233_g11099 [Leucocoprinus birnbaumii]